MTTIIIVLPLLLCLYSIVIVDVILILCASLLDLQHPSNYVHCFTNFTLLNFMHVDGYIILQFNNTIMHTN